MAIQTVKTGAAVNDGTGDDARTAFTKINQNFTDSANAASRQVGTTPGNVMEVGAFGLGAKNNNDPYGFLVSPFENNAAGFYRDANSIASATGGTVLFMHDGAFMPMIIFPLESNSSPKYRIATTFAGVGTEYLFRTSQNTSVDSNGFIKAASPIVKLFADKIELNDEAKQQPISFEKLGVGDYLVKGSLGFAQEGWYIEMPKDANGNVLVAVVYKQLPNNDISVKTYAKMFDEETGDIVANTAKPRDIPATRWIDLRLQALPQLIQPFSEDETVATNAE